VDAMPLLYLKAFTLLTLYLYATEKIGVTAIEEHDNLKCMDNSRTSVVLDNRQWVVWVNYKMSMGVN